MTFRFLPKTPVSLALIPGPWTDADELPELTGIARPFRKEDFHSGSLPCFTVFRTALPATFISLDLMLSSSRIITAYGRWCSTVIDFETWPLGSITGYQRFTPEPRSREFLQGFFNTLVPYKHPELKEPFHPGSCVLARTPYKQGVAFAQNFLGENL